MNEIVEESQKLANPIWQRYEKTGWYPFQEEVLKERKIEKKPKTSKCCYVRINFLCDQYMVVFVGAGHYTFRCTFPALTEWARSTLEGWKISACSHLHCSPVFHIYLK